jgi:RNA polymerase sigma-70 factor, ECF subfamily
VTTPRRIPPQDAAEVAALYLAEASALSRRALVLRQGDRQSAEDIVQQTFEAAAMGWQEVRRLSADERRKWLFRVLERRGIDTWRRDRRLYLIPEPDGVINECADHPPDLSEQVVRKLSREQLWKELQAMPSAQYRVAYLEYQLGWTAREISTELNISQSTVRAHRRNALIYMRTRGIRVDRAGDDDVRDRGEASR